MGDGLEAFGEYFGDLQGTAQTDGVIPSFGIVYELLRRK